VDTLFVHSDSLIYVISPPHVAGVVDVIVSTSTGDSSPSPDTQFTFIATEDPTPVLTFATPASASVVYGDSLTNAATSDISRRAPATITYSSSDEGNVATVDARPPAAITTVAVGTATITATQAAADGVNAEAARQTYLLTVTAWNGLDLGAPRSAPAPSQLGDTVDLTITVTNDLRRRCRRRRQRAAVSRQPHHRC
jgi:hypothetical protein